MTSPIIRGARRMAIFLDPAAPAAAERGLRRPARQEGQA